MTTTYSLLSYANKQRRLCNYSPFVSEFESVVDASFLKNGYVLIPDVSDAQEALLTSHRIIKGLRDSDVFYAEYVDTLRLSKADQIPVCESFIGTGFQALHFDYGLPLLPLDETASTVFDLVVALYYPYTASEVSHAKTRVVSLENVPKLNSLSKERADQRLKNYVAKFGDGWATPEVYNSHRLSIFARVIDACLGTQTFGKKIEDHSQNFFMPSSTFDQVDLTNQQIEMEMEYFASVGIDLTKVEKQFCLQPGNLLLIDNIRCVHGRIGNRKPKEVWQFLFGFDDTPTSLIEKTRTYLAGCIGRSN